jgi:hypothetical protein
VLATTATTGSPTWRTLPTASAKSLIWLPGGVVSSKKGSVCAATSSGVSVP